jgi:hypothetical protein
MAAKRTKPAEKPFIPPPGIDFNGINLNSTLEAAEAFVESYRRYESYLSAGGSKKFDLACELASHVWFSARALMNRLTEIGLYAPETVWMQFPTLDIRLGIMLLKETAPALLQSIPAGGFVPQGKKPFRLDAKLVRNVEAAAEVLRRDRWRASEVVVLGSSWKEPVYVLGKPKRFTAPGQFRVVKALADAGTDGLAKDELEKVNETARRTLRALRTTDGDWSAVIQMAEVKGGRYRLVNPAR